MFSSLSALIALPPVGTVLLPIGKKENLKNKTKLFSNTQILPYSYLSIYASLRDMAGSVPDHHNKVNIAVK